jgi:hypothetical protein
MHWELERGKIIELPNEVRGFVSSEQNLERTPRYSPQLFPTKDWSGQPYSTYEQMVLPAGTKLKFVKKERTEFVFDGVEGELSGKRIEIPIMELEIMEENIWKSVAKEFGLVEHEVPAEEQSKLRDLISEVETTLGLLKKSLGDYLVHDRESFLSNAVEDASSLHDKTGEILELVKNIEKEHLRNRQ